MTLLARSDLFLHLGLVLAGFGTLAVLPPARGPMWLVPMTPAGRERLVALAVADGARLVAPGRVAGSVVVMGERARLWRPMLAAGVLVLGAAPGGCHPSRDGRAA